MRVNGREHEIELVERLGELSVRAGGEPIDVDYEEVDDQGQVLVLSDRWSHAVSVENAGERCGITIAGHFYDVAIEDERERAAHAAERAGPGAGGTVLSVMPGVVVRVLVCEGQEVQEGDALLILEAMKMQNEIPAPGPGVVSALHVREGLAVRAGEKLVTLRPRAD